MLYPMCLLNNSKANKNKTLPIHVQRIRRDETSKQENGTLQHVLYIKWLLLRLILVFVNSLKCKTITMGRITIEKEPGSLECLRLDCFYNKFNSLLIYCSYCSQYCAKYLVICVKSYISLRLSIFFFSKMWYVISIVISIVKIARSFLTI